MENTTKKRFWRTVRLSGLFVREIIGWLLMLIGLMAFFFTWRFYINRSLVIEGMELTIIGFILFRSGLQLVKVAVAARAIRDDHQTVTESSATREFSPVR